jgi:cyclophilin family peptidyl-prolyl cis-trans isomerase
MLFWIKNILLTVFLLGAVVFLLFGQDWVIPGDSVAEKPGRITQSTTKTKEELQAEKDAEEEAFSMTTSGAAKGLSNFYGKVKEELLGNKKTLGDGYVLRVEPSIYTLEEQLQQRGDMVTPGSPKFTGEHVNRHFRVGDTIRKNLIQAAEDEGMELIWRLDRDYIIKHYFQVESNLLGVLGTVAKALDSDFEKDVFAYYCFKERAVIITHESSEYVQSNCKLANSKS